MKRAYLSGASETPPDVSQLTSVGYPTDGDNQRSIPPTVPGAAWAYVIEQEILNVIQAAGLTPTNAELDQLKTAIPKYLPAALAAKSISGSKLVDGSVPFAALESAAMATLEEAKAGALTNKLMSPYLVDALADKLIAAALQNYAQLAGATFTGEVKGVQAVSDNGFVTRSQVQSLVESIPVGSAILWFGADVPDKFLICNGATLQRSAYPALTNVLKNIPQCAGDGSTTIKLPDFTGRVPQGTTTVADIGKKIAAGLPNITGSHFREGYTGTATWSGCFYKGSESSAYYGAHGSGSKAAATLMFSSQSSNSTYGKSSTVQAPSILECFIMKSS